MGHIHKLQIKSSVVYTVPGLGVEHFVHTLIQSCRNPILCQNGMFVHHNFDLNMKCRYRLIIFNHQIDQKHHIWTKHDVQRWLHGNMDNKLSILSIFLLILVIHLWTSFLVQIWCLLINLMVEYGQSIPQLHVYIKILMKKLSHFDIKLGFQQLWMKMLNPKAWYRINNTWFYL